MSKVYTYGLERDGLDRNLGGGFPESALIFIEGGSGGGKSVICQRLTYGFLSNNLKVTFISTQQTTKGFIHQMYSLDYPVADFLLNRSLLFIPVVPLVKAARSRLDFVDRLINADALYTESDIIIIDTISSLIKYDVDPMKGLELIDFFKKVVAIGKVIIMTADIDSLDEEVSSVFKSTCDVYIELKSKAMMGDIKRSIYVNKFIGAPDTFKNIVGFRVEPKIGLVIDISAVS
ncbi:MAG: ATPase domain-containing protein [Halobacteriota archaeon]|nr:ATPase domain-containing protein [Halobacteriota archaeon]